MAICASAPSSHCLPDLVVDTISSAATVGHREALSAAVDIARKAGTAFHTGALTVLGVQEVGTGLWTRRHAALIHGIGWTCHG
jgi:hypothetical protein